MLTIDIFYIDDFVESKHPRAKGGANAGQFVKKGEEGGEEYQIKGKNKFRIVKGIPLSNSPTEGRKIVHKLATSAEADSDPHAVAKKIIEHTSNFTTFAHYSNKVLRAMEDKYHLPKNSLGIAANKGSTPTMPKQSAKPPEPKAEVEEPKKEEPKEPPKTEEPPKKEEQELPLPHSGSLSQQQMHSIAVSASTPKEEKIKQLQAISAPSSFAQEYKAKLLEAIAPGTKPEAPPSAPASHGTEFKPTKPPPSWHSGMKVLNDGVRSTMTTWDDEKAKSAMNTVGHGFWNKVPEAKAAAKEYVGSSSAINAALRSPDSANEYAINQIHAIDSAFEREEAKTKEDMVVYRGLPLSSYTGGETLPIEKLKKALTLGLPAHFHWDGFVSTSFATQAAFSGQDVQVEIGVPKGSPALAFGGSFGYKSENEVLLPHGRSFQVLAIQEIPGAKKRYKVQVVMK